MSSTGTINLDKVFYKIGPEYAFEQVLVISDSNQPGATIIVTGLDGETLAERTRPEPSIRYVGNSRPRGRRPSNQEPSPKS